MGLGDAVGRKLLGKLGQIERAKVFQPIRRGLVDLGQQQKLGDNSLGMGHAARALRAGPRGK